MKNGQHAEAGEKVHHEGGGGRGRRRGRGGHHNNESHSQGVQGGNQRVDQAQSDEANPLANPVNIPRKPIDPEGNYAKKQPSFQERVLIVC